MSRFIAQLMAILVLIGTVFLTIVSIKSNPTHFYACAAAMVHRNHFFRLYHHNKSTESEVNFREVSNPCKKVLEVAKVVYANKTKESVTFQKRGSRCFRRIVNSVPNNGKSAIPPQFNGTEVLSSASDKEKLF